VGVVRRAVAIVLSAGLTAACTSQASRTPSNAIVTAEPSASPVPSAVAPTAAPSPSPSPWVSLIDPGWDGAAWSPDGQWLLVWRQTPNGSPGDEDLLIDRPDGSTVQRFHGAGANGDGGFDPVWLDGTRFLVAEDGCMVMGTVGSGSLVPFAPIAGLGLTSNGHGAVAWVDTTFSVSAQAARYVVSTSSGSTPSRPGIPQGWSHDSTRLVVWHWSSGEGMETLGWLEVLSWPGLHTIAAFPDELAFSSAPQALFDLTDRYLLGEDGRLHDLVTGTKTGVLWPGDQVVDAAWNQSDQVVGADLASGQAIAYDVMGHEAFETGPIGDDISGSRDGSAIALWFGDTGGTTLTILSGTQQRQIEAPGAVQDEVLLSPDGSRIVIGSSDQPLLLRQP